MNGEMKTRVSVRPCLLVTVFFIMGLAFAHNAIAQDKPTLLYGVLDAKVREFRFVITVGPDKEATLKSLDEGGREFKLDGVELDDSTFRFELKASRARYESSFDSDSGTYKGKWNQNGNSLDLAFRKVQTVPKDPVSEIWEGELDAGIRKLTMRFRVYDRKDHAVLFDSPKERVGGFVGSLKRNDDEVVFEIPALRGKFTGKLSDDGKTLVGKWNQGIDFPLELKKIPAEKISKDAEPPKRPQTPKPPFPYRSLEVTIPNPKADLTLAGTLTVPSGGDSHPCVVLISGSGPQDRDETLLGHKPFLVIADHFSRNGIACLRFDDRGTAKSTGDHSRATTADFATDVNAIVDYLKTRPEIDAKKIGLCGHSEGGLIGPMVAAERSDIAFLVMLAGPGVNGEKILKNQLRKILLAGGTPQQEIETASFLQEKLIEYAKKGTRPTDEQISDLVDQVMEKNQNQQATRELVQTQIEAGIGRLFSPWMKFFLTYEPAPTLEKVQCPVLVLIGSKDTQVDPDLNLPAIRRAFESSGKKDFVIREFPDLNHLFQHCQTGSPSEYESIEETFSPEVLQVMTGWILQVCK